MDVLERYRPIVDDFDAFRAACERDLPTAVRVNGLAATPDEVRAAFDEAGVAYRGVEWTDSVLLVETDEPGNTWPAVHGWVHGQEEVSTVPPVALDPQPGERVWDACAAPGGKTTQIAARMDDRGTVVANDPSLGRLAGLRSNAERLGVTSAVVTRADARNYSMQRFPFDTFDRTLVDAPCSCEGTIRKNPDAFEEWSEDYLAEVAGLQTGILRRAVQATREGGTVVYSTCTFAPEENEAVLDAVLAAEDCRLVDPGIPDGLAYRDGVTEWDGETFDPAVERAARIYPHHNDTGGFFVARLEVGA